jgi:hypothetical protein
LSDFEFPEPPEGMTPEKWAQLHDLAAEAGAEHVREAVSHLEEAFDGDLVLDSGSVYLAWVAVQMGMMGADVTELVKADPDRKTRLLRGVELARGTPLPTTSEPDVPGEDAGNYRRALVDVARILPAAEPGEDTPVGRAHDRIHRALYPQKHVRGDG